MCGNGKKCAKDFRHPMTALPRPLAGKGAVDWLLTSLGGLVANRDEAVAVGAEFVRHGILKGTGHLRFLDSPTSYYELPATRCVCCAVTRMDESWRGM
jgi:hypothetical protein